MSNYDDYQDYSNEQLWDRIMRVAQEGQNFDCGEDDWHINEIKCIIHVLEERCHEEWGINND